MYLMLLLGLGFADIENRLLCKPETIFRIASISKPITMAMVAKLWENGDLNLDKPVQYYVPDFPEKTFQGKKVYSIFFFILRIKKRQPKTAKQTANDKQCLMTFLIHNPRWPPLFTEI